MSEETAMLMIEAINQVEDRLGSIVLFLGVLLIGKIISKLTEWMS